MPTLLHIDSSPLYGRSVSRELTAAFVTQWKVSHPDGRVLERDLNATSIPPINAEWIAAVYTPEEARTAHQKELLSLSDSLIAELEQADEYVFGVPMHNFGVPSVLKLWIDQVARVGRTFSYANGAPKGLMVGKKAIDTKYRIGSGDSGTLKKFKQYGAKLTALGYEPVFLILRSDNLPAAIQACRIGGWKTLIGQETFDFILKESGFDMLKFLTDSANSHTVTRKPSTP